MNTNTQPAGEASASISAPRATKAQPTKSAIVTKLLARSKGATLTEIASATNWQSHSCRAFLTGLRKQGKTLVKEQRTDGAVAYRITVADVAAEAVAS
jgi:predicted transcriptional regulator